MSQTGHVDHGSLRLGKRAPRHDPRTLMLANYLQDAALPEPPASIDFTAKVSAWQMMKNDTLGDCTCAAAGHLVMEWTSLLGSEVVPTDDQIVAAYSAISGYDPATGAHDDGAVEVDVLNYWRRTGIAGRQIVAYAALEPGNVEHVRDAVYLFDGVYIGVALPVSAQRQRVWSVPPGGATGQGAPGSWGGHAVPVVGYDRRGLTVVTWGATKRMTWGFWRAYCDEAYAIISQDFIDKSSGRSTEGFDLAALQADLRAVTG